VLGDHAAQAIYGMAPLGIDVAPQKRQKKENFEKDCC